MDFSPPDKKSKGVSAFDKAAFEKAVRGKLEVREEWEKCSLCVGNWEPNQVEQLSDLKLISGYPWRLRLVKRDDKCYELFVRCEKPSDIELWDCDAYVKFIGPASVYTTYSWTDTHEMRMAVYDKAIAEGTCLEVKIHQGGREIKWRSYPVLDPFEVRDGVLLIGKAEKKICVPMKFLASLSPFFHRIFNGENKLAETPITNVEYEEFTNLLYIVHGDEKASLTDENAPRVLQLAHRFELKIVEDRVVNFLLSSSCSLSIDQKTRIADQFNIKFLKDKISSQICIAKAKSVIQAFEKLKMKK